MSSRQLEDKQEQEQAEALAAALGIEADELDEVLDRFDPHESDEGVLYGYNVYFRDDADPEILGKIPGAEPGGFKRIGPDL